MVKSRNEALYKFYRAVGYDYLFYTVISFLFLTQTKGLSVGQIMYISAIYYLTLAIFQIPASYIVEKMGLKKALILGNLFWVVHAIIIILADRFIIFAFCEPISAFGSALKCLTETQILYESLKKSNNAKNFSKIEGSGVAAYYVVEALSCIFIGSLFEINNYIPIFMTLAVFIISLITSMFFEEVENESSTRVEFKEFKNDFKQISKSKRIKSIFIYVIVMSGIIGVMKTLQKDTIVSLGATAMEYSYIFAVLTFCVGIGSKSQYLIEKITKRKTLTYLGYVYTGLLVALGVLVISLSKINLHMAMVVSIAILIVHNLTQGIYRISVKKYINNFTTRKIRGKILSLFYICEGVGQAVMLAICGFMTDITSTNITLIIFGILTLVAIYYILKYMKKHLGLNPEEYPENDIFGVKIKENKVKEENKMDIGQMLGEIKDGSRVEVK